MKIMNLFLSVRGLEILIFYRTTDNIMDYHLQDNFFKGNSEKQQLSQDEF